MANSDFNKRGGAGMVMAACAILGVGIGMLVHQVGAGAVIGVGAGLLGMFALRKY